MNNRPLFIFFILLLIAVLSFNGYSFYVDSQEKVAVSSFFEIYGPGDDPHPHQVDFTRHKKVTDISNNPSNVPQITNNKDVAETEILMEIKEVIAEIAPGVETLFLTYGGKVPGPFLRIREGDMVKITLNNPEENLHTASIDLHAVTGPGGGGKIQVVPGEEKSFSFKALTPGLFIYHGASGNVGSLMSQGMHGLILVEPKEGLSKVDKEFYVVQGEYFLEGPMGERGFKNFSSDKYLREEPTYIVLNGRVNSLVDSPMEANVGETVRIYFGNAGVAKVSSFHIIGEIFDKVFREGSLLSLPSLGIQTTVVPAGGAVIVELELEYPGDYVLVDHSLVRIDKGAWGILRVSGEKNPEVFSSNDE